MNEVEQMDRFWTHMELLAYAVSLLTLIALTAIVWGLVIGFVGRRKRLPTPDRTAERTCYRVGGDCK